MKNVENLESSIAQEPLISETSIEHEEQVKDAKVNELVNKQNLMEVLQLNDQELTNGTEGTYRNKVFEIVEENGNEVIILTDQVEFSSDESLNLVISNDDIEIENDIVLVDFKK